MAHTIFDALSGVCLDNSTVQSLLDSETLVTQIQQAVIDQDEEDIFQCGKCKSQFTSLHLFLQHKQDHIKVEQQSIEVNQYLESKSTQVVPADVCPNRAQYHPQVTYDQMTQLNEPIILQESDMLFSIDQESASYLASDSGFSVPIVLNSESLDSFGNPSVYSDSDPLNAEVHTVPPINNKVYQNGDYVTSNVYRSFPTEISVVDQDSNQNVNNDDNEPSEQESQATQTLKYKCDYCEKQFSKKFYWQQHERSHTGEKPYQCVVCGRSFAQKSNVKKHMSSHKVWPGTAIHSLPPEAPTHGSIDKAYHCQFCKEIFDSYKALKAHLIVSHMTLKVYKCVQLGCSMMFQELDDFLIHTRTHKISEYRCHVCGEVFTTLTDLGLHQYRHSVQKHKTTEKYYSCTICKSSFSNMESLNHHMETNTHDHACPHCGKSFQVERFLRRHLKTHTTLARFTCEDCGKAFKTEQYLANHKLIHSDETPYACSDCPSRFKRKDRLRRHTLIHDLTKRLKCPYRNYLGCMREFSRPDKLKRHLLTHSNIKRFRCNLCNKNFYRTQALKHHQLNKHCLKCEVCSLEFRTTENLMGHVCQPIVDADPQPQVSNTKSKSGKSPVKKKLPRAKSKEQAEETKENCVLSDESSSDCIEETMVLMTDGESAEKSMASSKSLKHKLGTENEINISTSSLESDIELSTDMDSNEESISVKLKLEPSKIEE